MTEQDQILAFLAQSGPTIPSKVAKLLNCQILLASAHLSDLAAQGKVKISHLKYGGSPLYYLAGQEEQLDLFAAGNLNPKDLLVWQRLKGQKLLREQEQDLLTKVALRGLKDFAIPLQVTVEGKTELFWKWHLFSEEETNQKITHLLQPIPASALEDKPLPLPETVKALPEQLPEQPKEQQKTLLGEKEEKPKPREKKIINDEFLPEVEKVFSRLKIKVDQKEILRKNAEMNLLVKVPSIVGEMTYFCKAKKKAKCDEKDLAAAYMEAQGKKLPLLFMYTSELTKKAQEMLRSGAFENVVARKIT